MTITIDRAVLEKALNDIDTGTNALSEALNAPQPVKREWVELTLDQISMAWDKAYRQPLSQAALNFARDIEAALKERNT